jgi:WXG100 family type VII secretion target
VAVIVQADYPSLDTVANRFDQQGHAIHQMSDATHAAEAWLRQNWQGAAASAFFVEYEHKIRPALARLEDALREAGVVTRLLEERFDSADQQAATPFGTTAQTGSAARLARFADAAWHAAPASSPASASASADHSNPLGTRLAAAGFESPLDFSDSHSLSGIRGSTAADYMVPRDWLDNVKPGSEGSMPAAGSTGGGASGKPSGSGGGVPTSGGGTGSGGGGTPGGAMNFGTAGLGTLGYQAGPGTGFDVNGNITSQSSPAYTAAAVFGAPAAAQQSQFELPVAIGVLSPLLAVLGKALKDRIASN